jgi:hypothetical protein
MWFHEPRIHPQALLEAVAALEDGSLRRIFVVLSTGCWRLVAYPETFSRKVA